MCWNIKVSMLFAWVHIMTFILTHVIKPQGYKQYKIFLAFYTIMELFQASQWAFVTLGTDATESCDPLNTFSTFIAYILIWAQPIMYAYIDVYVNNEKENNSVNMFALRASIATFCIAMYNLLFKSRVDRYVAIAYTNYGEYTCTYIGQYGHLQWMFYIPDIGYQPTHIVFLILICTSFSFYKNIIVRNTLFFGLLATLILTVFRVGDGPELPAYWCMLTAFADIPIIIRCCVQYIQKNRANKE